MARIGRLCVYCGSSGDVDPVYREAARELGARMAAAGIGLVFGGGHIGLMGIVADAVMAGGGEVIGVIPESLRARELAHGGLTELIVVDSMHDRKRVMAERADGFAALPGGIGTLDETFEIMTWRMLRLHDKPIYLIDVGGYWQKLVALLDHIAAARFSPPLIPALIEPVPSVDAMMQILVAANR